MYVGEAIYELKKIYLDLSANKIDKILSGDKRTVDIISKQMKDIEITLNALCYYNLHL